MIIHAAELIELNSGQYESLLRKIPKEKQRQAGRFRYRRDSLRTVLGYNLARVMLEKYFGMKQIHIEFNPYGRPYLSKEKAFFSISHSGKWVVCAVDKVPVGIDIQKQSQVWDIWSVGQEALTEKEYDRMRRSTDSRGYFFDCWCRKEAAIKCMGKGLFMMKEIETAKGSCMIENKRYYLKQIKGFSGYSFAVCSEGDISNCQVEISPLLNAIGLPYLKVRR